MFQKAGPTGRTEFPAAWYDDVYRSSVAYKADPDGVSWRPIWDEAIRRLPPSAIVADLGCGVGQFAELLARRRPDIRAYTGYDFSEVAIEAAKAKALPHGFRFACRELRTVQLRELRVVTVCLEVMEHLDDDRLPLRIGRPGRLFIGSVPGYDSASHVRTYDEAMIRKRFGAYLDGLEITAVPVARWKRAYVFAGTLTKWG
jgi:SAM-dependent methyltransferase